MILKFFEKLSLKYFYRSKSYRTFASIKIFKIFYIWKKTINQEFKELFFLFCLLYLSQISVLSQKNINNAMNKSDIPRLFWHISTSNPTVIPSKISFCFHPVVSSQKVRDDG